MFLIICFRKQYSTPDGKDNEAAMLLKTQHMISTAHTPPPAFDRARPACQSCLRPVRGTESEQFCKEGEEKAKDDMAGNTSTLVALPDIPCVQSGGIQDNVQPSVVSRGNEGGGSTQSLQDGSFGSEMGTGDRPCQWVVSQEVEMTPTGRGGPNRQGQTEMRPNWTRLGKASGGSGQQGGATVDLQDLPGEVQERTAGRGHAAEGLGAGRPGPVMFGKYFGKTFLSAWGGMGHAVTGSL